MAKTLTLEISDTIYDLLIKTSAQIGQTPEQVILEERVAELTAGGR